MPTPDVLELTSFWPAHADFFGPFEVAGARRAHCGRTHATKRLPSNAKAATITGAQLRYLLRVTDATSRAPERDRLVLLLGLTCAMRVTEMARVLVEDVLLVSPAAPLIVTRRGAGFAFNRKPRTLADGEVEDYWACDALQAHV